jgi:hypothetical protein
VLTQFLYHSCLLSSMLHRTGRTIDFSKVATCLGRIFHEDQIQSLSMACERYVCRLTPGFAALCLSTNMLVPRMFDCWRILFGTELSAALLSGHPGKHRWHTYRQGSALVAGIDLALCQAYGSVDCCKNPGCSRNSYANRNIAH